MAEAGTLVQLVTMPAFPLLAAALLVALWKPLRAPLVVLAPLATLLAVWQVGEGVQLSVHFLGYSIELVQADALRRSFAVAFALVALGGGLFALRDDSRTALAAGFACTGAAVGACFAGDFSALMLFWQALLVFAALLVWCGGSDAAWRAGIRYAIVHLLVGLALKVGVEWLAYETGSNDLRALALEGGAAWLLAGALLVAAAAWPLGAWLPDAYPESSASGAVFLSACTSGTALLALMLLFPGAAPLLWIGIATLAYGLVYGLLEHDARRLLAYALVAHSGLVIAAIGLGASALPAAALLALVQLPALAVLMAGAGAVLRATGERRLERLGGLARSLPWASTASLVAAAALAGAPLTAGFTAQSALLSAAAASGGTAAWLLLAAGMVGSALLVGLRYPWLLWFAAPAHARTAADARSDAGFATRAGLGVLALSLVLPVLLPGGWPLPVTVTVDWPAALLERVQLLLAAVVGFLLLRPLLVAVPGSTRDVDALWRELLPAGWRRLAALWGRLAAAMLRWMRGPLRRGLHLLFQPHGPEGLLARSWPTGSMLLWVTVMLAALLLAGAVGVL